MNFGHRLLLGLASAGALALGAPAAHAATPVFFNELHYDNASTDTGEAIEIAGPAGTDLSGWSVVLYNGSNNASYGTSALSGTLADQGDGMGTTTVEYSGIQNGNPDGLALVDATGVVRQFLSYGGVITAANGPAAGITSTDIGVRETSATPAGQSLQLRGTGRTAEDFTWAAPAASSFGARNAGQSFGTTGPGPGPEPEPEPDQCQRPSTAIPAVQGSGPQSSRVGETVTVRGVVTGDFQGSQGLSGFFIQDPAGDGNAATSDGLFVYSSAPDVAVGDVVAATGRVTEFTRSGRSGSLTQLTDADVSTCGTAAVPAATGVSFPAGPDELERFESMLTTVVTPMYLTEYFQLDNFGEVRVSSGGVLPTPTDVAEPGDEARAVAADNARRTLTVDDGSSRSFPATVPFGATATDPIRRGDVATGLEGIMHFDHGVFRLQPTGTVGFAERNPREPAPTVAGDIRIASFNVLNYFTTLNSRGARTAAEFEQQEAKVVSAISGLGADVVALQEIEFKRDTTDPLRNQPSETLVAALNERDGAGTWAATRIPRNFSGTDVITTAIIYRADRVTTVGEPVALPDPAFENARQPIAQTFDADGERFTVVTNHFKSKRCGDATGANADTGDGQGCWNADRVEQAEALAGFVATLADAADDDDVIVLGDLNAYTREDPLDVLRGAGLLDQRRDLPRDEAYSYVFDGGQGVLDHALATPSWDARRTGAAAWHLNADEPDAYQYSGVDALYAPGPFRSSDHDPLLLGYARDTAPTCFGRPATIVGTDAAEKLTGTNGPDVIVGRGGDDLIIGAGAEDLVCGGAGDDRLYGNNGKDRLDGGTGDDEVLGGNGEDELVGGPGADRLDGGNGDDRVVADATDTVHGGRGDNVVTRP